MAVPQGSMRALTSKAGVPYVCHTNNGLKAWRKTVKDYIHDRRLALKWEDKMAGGVYVYLVFVMPKPKSAKRRLLSVRPDVDKLTRAVLDAATDAGMWADDGQVTEIHAFKRYARDGEEPHAALYCKELE